MEVEWPPITCLSLSFTTNIALLLRSCTPAVMLAVYY
jgi:hypothetical protein